MSSKFGYPQLSEATCYMITHVEKVVNTSTNSYMQVNVIPLFQLDTVSLKTYKKFCDENPSMRRAMLLNNNHSRTYEVKDELDTFSVNTINPSDPQTLQNLIKECVKYQNEH